MSDTPPNGVFLKKYNLTNVLNIIRIHHSISRAALSKHTGLSQTAIGSMISELIQGNYIVETGTGRSNGGRKPILLQLKQNYYYSVGVDLDSTQIRVVIVNLLGNIIQEKLFPLENTKHPQQVFEFIEAKVYDCLKECEISVDRIIGICIAVPGAVNNSIHKIIYSPILGWEDIAVPPYFNSIPNVSLLLENDANAYAIYEHWLGSCQGLENFVCVIQTSGIGAGVFINGKLYRGMNGISAQIGHIQVDENGPLCKCGNYGCLEAVAADSYLVDRMKRMIRQGITSLVNVQNVDEINIDMIRTEAFNGNVDAMNILTEAATYLGIGTSILINILNPSKIVFGKGFLQFPDIFMSRIKAVANNKVLKIFKTNINIEASTANDGAIAVGAAVIPLKSLFGEEVTD